MHLARAPPAVVLVERQGTIHDADEGRHGTGQNGGKRRDRVLHGGHERLQRRRAVVHGSTRDGTKHHGAHSEDIRADVDFVRLPPRLLGREVAGRPDDDATQRRHGRDDAVADAREAEVEQLRVTRLGEKDVPRLDVAVHDSIRMRHVEDVEELPGDAERLGEGEPTSHAGKAARERLALEQLHDEVRRPVLGDVVIENVDRARMADLVGDVPLAQETPPHLGVGGGGRVQHLDGGVATVAVGRLVDARRAAHVDEALDAPLAVQRLAQALLGGSRLGRGRLHERHHCGTRCLSSRVGDCTVCSVLVSSG